jgi:acetyltransferase-like isoleucine patch superfamily enzyme
VSVFLPELSLLFIIVQNVDNYFLWITFALISPVVYFFSVMVFGIIHSQIICKVFLPPIKPGIYSHGSDLAYLYSVGIVSPSIFKSMLKAFSFVPHLYSLLIGKFLSLYGLKTGKNVYISAGTVLDSHLVSIGSDSLIGIQTIISAHLTESNNLVLKPVTIGKNVTIGGRSIITPGATIGDNVIIGANSLVTKDQVIPPNTIYAGIPAIYIRENDKS